MVCAAGTNPDPDELAPFKNMNPPDDVKGIRSFVGVTSYYRQYVPNYVWIAKSN